MEVSEADPLIGTLVADRYRVVRKLGEGGMGVVYQAVHEALRKPVAMKLLASSGRIDREAVARFEREAIAAANLRHPNIAEATDFGRLPDGALYLVMEYVEGTTLRRLLREHGRLGPERALPILEQVASALATAHEREVVHRDLKPENVIVTSAAGKPDFVKVIDFGIARIRNATFGGGATGLTKAGAVFGTPEYMAPEQVMGQPVDARADQYALGVLAFELLTGKPPFSAGDVGQLMMMHVGAPIPSSRERAPALPAAADQVLTRMLAKLPDERFASVADAMRALSEAFVAPPASAAVRPPLSSSATVRLGPPASVLDRSPADAAAATAATLQSFAFDASYAAAAPGAPAPAPSRPGAASPGGPPAPAPSRPGFASMSDARGPLPSMSDAHGSPLSMSGVHTPHAAPGATAPGAMGVTGPAAPIVTGPQPAASAMTGPQRAAPVTTGPQAAVPATTGPQPEGAGALPRTLTRAAPKKRPPLYLFAIGAVSLVAAIALVVLVIRAVGGGGGGLPSEVTAALADWKAGKVGPASAALKSALASDEGLADDATLARALAEKVGDDDARERLDELMRTTPLGRSPAMASALAAMAMKDVADVRDGALDLLRDRQDLLTKEVGSRVRLRDADDCNELADAKKEEADVGSQDTQRDLERMEREDCKRMLRRPELCGPCRGAPPGKGPPPGPGLGPVGGKGKKDKGKKHDD